MDLVKAHFCRQGIPHHSHEKGSGPLRPGLRGGEKRKDRGDDLQRRRRRYGMSGLMLEIGVDYPEVEVEVIPGVTAATGGAAVLGAPLIHDFALISLSDLLTPWEKIEARLLAAAQADFVVCLYNPSSRSVKIIFRKHAI